MASLTTCHPAADTVAECAFFVTKNYISCTCPITHVFLELAQNRENISLANAVKRLAIVYL